MLSCISLANINYHLHEALTFLNDYFDNSFLCSGFYCHLILSYQVVSCQLTVSHCLYCLYLPIICFFEEKWCFLFISSHSWSCFTVYFTTLMSFLYSVSWTSLQRVRHDKITLFHVLKSPWIEVVFSLANCRTRNHWTFLATFHTNITRDHEQLNGDSNVPVSKTSKLFVTSISCTAH